MSNALTPVSTGQRGPATDYELHKDHKSAWVQVGSISVHIARTDEGVVVDLYPVGLEMETEIASAQAFEKEAQQMIEESKEQK